MRREGLCLLFVTSLVFRFNKLTLDTDESEDSSAELTDKGSSELQLKTDQSEAKNSPDLLPTVQQLSLTDRTSNFPVTPPPLSFLNETREAEEKPSILKLLDSSHLPTSSFVMSSITVCISL